MEILDNQGTETLGESCYIAGFNGGHRLNTIVYGDVGSGKSMYLRLLINSIESSFDGLNYKVLILDPKMVEFSNYKTNNNKIIVAKESEVMKKELLLIKQELSIRKVFIKENYPSYKGKNIFNRIEKSINQYPPLFVLCDEYADIDTDIKSLIENIMTSSAAYGIFFMLVSQRVDCYNNIIGKKKVTRCCMNTNSKKNSLKMVSFAEPFKFHQNNDAYVIWTLLKNGQLVPFHIPFFLGMSKD